MSLELEILRISMILLQQSSLLSAIMSLPLINRHFTDCKKFNDKQI